MGTQFTPGPWFADFHNERRDGGRFTTMVFAKGHLVPIAAVPSGVEGYGREEGRANAQLVGAAPELFEACSDTLDSLVNLRAGIRLGVRDPATELPLIDAHIDLLKYAIAKANGQ